MSLASLLAFAGPDPTLADRAAYPCPPQPPGCVCNPEECPQGTQALVPTFGPCEFNCVPYNGSMALGGGHHGGGGGHHGGGGHGGGHGGGGGRRGGGWGPRGGIIYADNFWDGPDIVDVIEPPLVVEGACPRGYQSVYEQGRKTCYPLRGLGEEPTPGPAPADNSRTALVLLALAAAGVLAWWALSPGEGQPASWDDAFRPNGRGRPRGKASSRRRGTPRTQVRVQQYGETSWAEHVSGNRYRSLNETFGKLGWGDIFEGKVLGSGFVKPGRIVGHDNTPAVKKRSGRRAHGRKGGRSVSHWKKHMPTPRDLGGMSDGDADYLRDHWKKKGGKRFTSQYKRNGAFFVRKGSPFEAEIRRAAAKTGEPVYGIMSESKRERARKNDLFVRRMEAHDRRRAKARRAGGGRSSRRYQPPRRHKPKHLTRRGRREARRRHGRYRRNGTECSTCGCCPCCCSLRPNFRGTGHVPSKVLHSAAKTIARRDKVSMSKALSSARHAAAQMPGHPTAQAIASEGRVRKYKRSTEHLPIGTGERFERIVRGIMRSGHSRKVAKAIAAGNMRKQLGSKYVNELSAMGRKRAKRRGR